MPSLGLFPLAWSFADDYARRSHDLAVQGISFFHLFNHCPRHPLRVFDFDHRLVHIGIKDLTYRIDQLQPIPFECPIQLRMNKLYPLFESLSILRLLVQGPFHIV